MRRYVSQRDLLPVLKKLTIRKDLETVKIFKEVIMYRYSNQKAEYDQVRAYLEVPRVLFMCAADILAAVLCGALLTQSRLLVAQPFLQFGCSLLLYAFLCLEVSRFYAYIRLLKTAVPYILIDELINRRIIVVSRKEKQAARFKTLQTNRLNR